MTEPDIRETVRRRYAAAATSATALDYDQARAAEQSWGAPTAVSTTDAEGRVVFGAGRRRSLVSKKRGSPLP